MILTYVRRREGIPLGAHHYAPSGKEPSTMVDVFAERIAILELKVYAEVLNGRSQFRISDGMTGMIHMLTSPPVVPLPKNPKQGPYSGDKDPRTCQCHLLN